ncbi:MAG: restriction endonuclease [Spirochaetae bacterium HGW-Spirochaetae-5]|nr:MAG: restriction endonuclease [Spirochaetae bacterium HGW-Spirochaetae-5]
MKFVEAFSLHNGDVEWQRRDQYEWLTDVFEAPQIMIAAKCTGRIREHVKNELTNAGWSYDVRINQAFDLTITGIFRDMAFQIQTGNISRAPYDLMKLQYLYTQKKIEVGAIAVPTKKAASIIGSNIANVDRIWNEAQLFDRIITLPLLILSFE